MCAALPGGSENEAPRLSLELRITNPDPRAAFQHIERLVLTIVLVQRRIGAGDVLLYQRPGRRQRPC